MSAEIPLAFRQYRELFKIHTTQILTLDRKSPIHAVPLLVTIACEVLGKLTGRRGEDVFANDLKWPEGAKPAMTRKLFDALRNGLAHAYGPYPILLDGQEDVRLIMSWKKGPLLAPVGVKIRDGHAQIVAVEEGEQAGPWICLDVESLWNALDKAFSDLEARIRSSPLPTYRRARRSVFRDRLVSDKGRLPAAFRWRCRRAEPPPDVAEFFNNPSCLAWLRPGQVVRHAEPPEARHEGPLVGVSFNVREQETDRLGRTRLTASTCWACRPARRATSC